MKEGWMKIDEGWMKNDEGWRLNDEGWWFLAVEGFWFMTDEPMNKWTFECRVAFATEKQDYKSQLVLKKWIKSVDK